MSASLPSANNDTITFKSDRHAEIISEKQLSFYEKKELCDAVLIAGSDCVNIHANRNVLSVMSEYFFEIFCGSQSDSSSKDNKVELREIEATTLKSIVHFMYSGSIELNLKNAESILRAAAILKMKTLLDGCCDFLEKHIDSSNCLKWLILSKELSLSALRDKSSKYTYTHFEEISKQKELLLLNEIQLKGLLFDDNPYGDFEELVFLSMVAWIEYDKANRTNLIFQLLSMVRYQLLTPNFIIRNRRRVCNSVESNELICSWLEWHLSPEIRQIDQKNCNLLSRKDDVEVKEEAVTQIQQLTDQQNSVLEAREDFQLAFICSTYEEVTIHMFDSAAKSWFIKRQIPLWQKRTDYGFEVMKGMLIIAGGFIDGKLTNSVQCYNLRTLEWGHMPPMQYPEHSSVLIESDDESLYAFSGQSKRLDIYNFSTRIWSSSKYFPHGASIQNGKHYRITQQDTRLEIYDSSSGQRISKKLETKGIKNFSFRVVDEFVFLIGGVDIQGKLTRTLTRQNLSTKTWCEVAPLPRARANTMAIYFQNNILVMGGYPDRTWVDEYNPDTNSWTTLSSLLCDPGENYIMRRLPSTLYE